jgi:hypothetical protein
MATLTQVRLAMAEALKPLGCQVSGYPLSNPSPPCVQVLGPSFEYDRSVGPPARRLQEWQFRLTVLVSVTNDIASAQLMDEFVSPTGSKSVKAALERDSTLGGVVSDLRVERGQANQVATLQTTGGQVLVGELQVTVYARGA